MRPYKATSQYNSVLETRRHLEVRVEWNGCHLASTTVPTWTSPMTCHRRLGFMASGLCGLAWNMICTRTAWNSGIHFLLRKTQMILNSDTALKDYPVGEMTACMHQTVPFLRLLRSAGMTPCSLMDRYQSFGGICCLYLQNIRSSYILESAVENLATPDYTASLPRGP